MDCDFEDLEPTPTLTLAEYQKFSGSSPGFELAAVQRGYVQYCSLMLLQTLYRATVEGEFPRAPVDIASRSGTSVNLVQADRQSVELQSVERFLTRLEFFTYERPLCFWRPAML